MRVSHFLGLSLTWPLSLLRQVEQLAIPRQIKNKKILERYEITRDHKVIIDISISKIEDLYNKFDSAASYIKKDLNEDFVEYLIDCVREIKNHEFLIRINLAREEEETRIKRVRSSIKNYFQYSKACEIASGRQLLSRSCSYLTLGLLLISSALLFSARTGHVESLLKEILIEGVTIAAWVSVWEAVGNLIFAWPPHRQKLKIFQRVSESPVLFQVRPQT